LVWHKWVVVEAVTSVLFAGCLTTPKIKVSTKHRLDELSNHEGMDNENGAIHTKLTNIGGNGIELVLKWSGLSLLGLNGGKDLILTGIVSDNCTEEPSLTSLDLSS
jgi:hypothetical protein